MMMNRLAEVIDAHAWDELPDLLHEDFVCSYVTPKNASIAVCGCD